MLFRLLLTTVIVTLGLTVSSPSHATTIVFADDFSNPSGGKTFVTYTKKNASMGKWKINRGDIDLIGGYWQPPTVGGGSVDMDGNTPGSISQTLTLRPGNYELSFSLSGNPVAGNPLKSVFVSIGNASEIFNYNTRNMGTTKASMHYITNTLLFSISGLASEEERLLSFISQSSSGNAGAVIGNVQISTVPLPASYPLFLAAFTGLGAFGFFRRRQAL